MQMRAKFIAAAWLLLGTVTAALLAVDLVRVGDGFQRHPAIALVASPFVVFSAACFALSYGLFARRAFSFRLGIALPLVAGLLFMGYVAIKLFVLLRTGLGVSFFVCMGGLLGMGFCWATFRASATLKSPAPSGARQTAPGDD